MIPFKFFSGYNLHLSLDRGRYVEDDEHMGRLLFDDGTNIEITDRPITPHRLNHIIYDNRGMFDFWWSPNYEAFEHNHERYVGHYAVNTYIGPISSFYRNYSYVRNNNTEGGFYPEIPVIRKINFNNNVFNDKDLRFSDANMWVEVQYKRFIR